jgi:hypothetical protein
MINPNIATHHSDQKSEKRTARNGGALFAFSGSVLACLLAVQLLLQTRFQLNQPFSMLTMHNNPAQHPNQIMQFIHAQHHQSFNKWIGNPTCIGTTCISSVLLVATL